VFSPILIAIALFAVGNDMLYALPLIVAVSLVYSGTRYEDTKLILSHALRTAIWIIVFMAIIYGLLALVAWGL